MSETDDDLSLRSTGTLTLWLTCLIVGAAGPVYPSELPPSQISIRQVRASAAKTSIEVVAVQPQPSETRSTPVQQPQRIETQPPEMKTVPPLPPVAAVPPASPFLVPQKVVKQSTSATNPTVAAAAILPPIANAKSASVQTIAAPPADDRPAAVQQLVYGQGEGRQPPPIYPRESQLGRQEGTVVVRFSVDPNGNVTDAAVVTRCPWPLLNQSAVRAVKETWHFIDGTARVFEVAIRFQLQRR